MVGRAAAPLSRPLRAALRAALRLDSRPAGRFAPALNGPVPPHWPAGRGPRDSRCLRRGGFAAVPGSAPAARAWGCAARLRRAAPRFQRVKIGVRASASPPPFASPFLAALGRGFGRPDGLPRFHPSRRPEGPAASEFGPIFLLAALTKKSTGLPRGSGGPRAEVFNLGRGAPGLRPPARHRALGRPAVRDGPAALLTAAGRLPPRRPVRPRGRSRSPGYGATVGFASLRLAPRSPLLAARFAAVGIVGAAPCWARCARRYPPFEPFGPGGANANPHGLASAWRLRPDKNKNTVFKNGGRLFFAGMQSRTPQPHHQTQTERRREP